MLVVGACVVLFIVLCLAVAAMIALERDLIAARGIIDATRRLAELRRAGEADQAAGLKCELCGKRLKCPECD